MITYEQPLNEITRILLKIEYLLQMCDHHLRDSEAWDSHTVLNAICDILNLLDRPDLRSKLTKEVQRYISILSRLQTSRGINHAKLVPLLERLNLVWQQLLNGNGRLAQELRDDDFLNNIRQHLMSPAGTCNFDMPIYHYWSVQKANIRNNMIQYWYRQLNDIRELTTLLVDLVRDSGHFERLPAKNGFYQLNIDPSVPCQLIRVSLPDHATVFPEISAGRHRICVYFMNADFQRRPSQTTDTIDFELALCVI
ncbi:MAG: cell division protein ZapD [Gammaproteobacteria bacterium]